MFLKKHLFDPVPHLNILLTALPQAFQAGYTIQELETALRVSYSDNGLCRMLQLLEENMGRIDPNLSTLTARLLGVAQMMPPPRHRPSNRFTLPRR